jgi:hypothetical protein
MRMEELIKRIERLEYYQKLLLEMVSEQTTPFYHLIMRKKLTEKEVEEFFKLCERMNNKWMKQKAEKEEFVYYAPLFNEFKSSLHSALEVQEVIESCINQNLYRALMIQFQKNI